MTRDRKREEIAGQLSAISSLARSDLIERWVDAHGQPPPKGISRRLLEYSAAYHLQVKAFGGLKPATRRKLDRIAARTPESETTAPTPSKASRLTPGARLVREWHGRTHQIEVIKTGFVYKGDIYRSLSEIAREITGARWSGPRFFGL